jgi:uncharacterized membrane protein YgdD (TMEM256/DUF423 family)
MLFGTISAGLSVAFGAFGAHALKTMLSVHALQVYQTAAHYQSWHALALIMIGLMIQQQPQSRLLVQSAWWMLAGICLFSGSLYLLAITDLRWLGMVTPLGGVSLLVAWTLLSIALYRLAHESSLHR